MRELVPELVEVPYGIEIADHPRFRLELVPDRSCVSVVREDVVHDHIVPHNPFGR